MILCSILKNNGVLEGSWWDFFICQCHSEQRKHTQDCGLAEHLVSIVNGGEEELGQDLQHLKKIKR